MKRLIAAGILLLFVIGVCVAGNRTVSAAYNSASASIQQCERVCADGDFEAAKRHAEKLSSMWENRSLLLSVFVNHGDLEDIGETVERMTAYAANHDSAAYLGECAAARLLLEKIREDQTLRIDSFL